MHHFLKTEKTKIVTDRNKPVFLRGVNLGGWLMMEAYLLRAPNRPEKYFRKNFVQALGLKALQSFDQAFRQNFIREEDIRDIARYGFNCIRVPFHHRLVEKSPYRYDPDGLRLLDKVLRWGEKYKVWVILDLHAAPGCQNHDWHSDSFGQAELWKTKSYQQRTVALWECLADRYKQKEYLAGYDLLNEAVLHDTRLLNKLYKQVIKAIRSVDRNHILFIEGTQWARDVDCLDQFDDDNYVLSIHNYEPLDFTFNFVPHLTYPSKINGKIWNKATIRKQLSHYTKVSKRHNAPIFIGEFGVNARESLYGEHQWLEDTLKCYKEFGFHWTYWTYKAVKNSEYPDGIFSYVKNPPWVNRPGPIMGWDTYPGHWPTRKWEMIRSWHTDQFQVNTDILKILRNAAK
jgi:aryl-phospho-beta-D-glucosidase BglC (GH1 family)